MTRLPTTVPLAAILLYGCGPDATGATTDASTTAGADERGDTSTTSTTSPADSSDSSIDTSTSSTSSTGAKHPADFIAAPDAAGTDLECDAWADDCPRGYKCVPFADDGGHVWNATHCVPLVDDPSDVGEPCMYSDPLLGVDDCAAGSVCFDVHPDTLEGTCVGYCQGSESYPVCPDPCTRCVLSETLPIPFCLPSCDPLAQTCSAGSACVPVYDGFTCAPDSSGDMGALGDPCAFINACDPGLFCADPARVPGCRDANGCCAAFCDTSAQAPCAGMGVECEPWVDDRTAPCGTDRIGGCLLPQ